MFEELRKKASAYLMKYEKGKQEMAAELAEMEKRKSEALASKEKAVFSGDSAAYASANGELLFAEDRINALKQMQQRGAVTAEQFNEVIRETQRTGNKMANEVYARMYDLMMAWDDAHKELKEIDRQMLLIRETMFNSMPDNQKAGSALASYLPIHSVQIKGVLCNLDVFNIDLRQAVKARKCARCPKK